MSNVSIYKFDNTAEIRVVTNQDNPWFVASDVCEALDLAANWNTFRHLNEDERMSLEKRACPDHVLFPGRTARILTISESGLYKLVMRSDKPEAQRFQDWVTRDVLPAIRKDGAYIMGEEKVATGEMDEDAFVLKAIEILQRKIDRLSSENKQLTTERDGLSSMVGQRSSAGMTD